MDPSRFTTKPNKSPQRTRRPLVRASIEQQNGFMKIMLVNDSSRPTGFVVSGVLPEVTLSVDGNTSYEVSLSPNPRRTLFRVKNEKTKEILAEVRISKGGVSQEGSGS